VRLVTAGLLAGLGTAVAVQAAPVQARTGDGSEGFVLRGIGRAGSVVSDLGDVNGDGIADLVVGAPGAEGVGACYVVFGRTTGFPPVFDLEDLRPGAGGDGSEGTVLQAPGSSPTRRAFLKRVRRWRSERP
jgi:hypothetical protein